MTNEMIIFNERVTLMESGIIGNTGRKMIMEDAEGNKIEINEPEAIHTYQGWKALNRQVKRGEKAIASFIIWKHTIKKPKMPDEDEQEIMFMTKAHFFKISQTEAIKQ